MSTTEKLAVTCDRLNKELREKRYKEQEFWNNFSAICIGSCFGLFFIVIELALIAK